MIRLSIYILAVLLLLGSAKSHAQVDKFKAAYLYSICTYVEWPASERKGDFVIGILGNSKVGKEIKALAARKKLFGQRIVVKRFSSISKVKKCHVLYVTRPYYRYLPSLVVKIGRDNCLLFSERKGSIVKGAAINFVMRGKKLKFEIKRDNAIRQRLKINKAIERLAIKVY